jgi:hypothetical protein
MIKSCLIIDDNPQDAEIETIVRGARKQNIELNCFQFNVGSTQRSDLLTNGGIDAQKVIEIFRKEFSGTKIDLICIDYQLEDDKVSGLDILNLLHDLRKKCQYMIYSSNLDQVVGEIIQKYDKDKDKGKLISRIKTLTKYNIVDFAKRERYDAAIVEILVKNQPSLELIIEEKLLEHKDMVFSNTFLPLAGAKLEVIAEQIRMDTSRGIEFKCEIIEQTIAYMIAMNT